MDQRRFWARNFGRRPRGTKRVALSDRGIYEPVETEENVVGAVTDFLWRCGIPVFRQRERVPTCWKCFAKVCKESEAGHPDLHGYIPVRAAIRWAKDEGSKEWARANLKHPIPYYIEVKRPKGGRKRPAQILFAQRAVDDGVLAFFAKSAHEVRQAFANIGILLPDPNTYTMEAMQK